MKIRYDLTIDDLIAFSQYYNTNSPTMKRSKNTFIFWVSLVVIGASFLIKTTSVIARIGMVLGAVVYSILFSFVLKYAFQASPKKLVPRYLKEGTSKGVTGWHELEIDRNGLIEKTEVSETHHTWLGVSKIVETESHAFIFLSSMTAHVIPKGSVSTGDADQFIAQAKLYFSENSNNEKVIP